MLKKTPLYDAHLKLHAKMSEFGGFEMPIQYTSIIEEHMAVRTKAGIFDVSHMGEVLVEGEQAEGFLNGLLTNDIGTMRDGKVQYTIMTYEDGGTIDDLMVYRMDSARFLLVVNAANKDKDFNYIKNKLPEAVRVEDVSDDYAEIAVQGPESRGIARRILGPIDVKRFYFIRKNYHGESLIISRTGYTGEDGLEIYGSPEAIASLFEEFLEAGVTPCGLGARDTLRFEAGLPLYGHELSRDITPVEAGLAAFIKFNKDFCGKEVLYRQVNQNEGRRLIGLKLKEKGVPRQGYKIFFEDKEVGFVTSGNFCPYLKDYLAMALVKLPVENTTARTIDNKATAENQTDDRNDQAFPESYYGKIFEIEIRGKRLQAEAIPKNFLKAIEPRR